MIADSPLMTPFHTEGLCGSWGHGQTAVLRQVEQCRFAAFTAGPPHYDTVRVPGGATRLRDVHAVVHQDHRHISCYMKLVSFERLMFGQLFPVDGQRHEYLTSKLVHGLKQHPDQICCCCCCSC